MAAMLNGEVLTSTERSSVRRCNQMTWVQVTTLECLLNQMATVHWHINKTLLAFFVIFTDTTKSKDKEEALILLHLHFEIVTHKHGNPKLKALMYRFGKKKICLMNFSAEVCCSTKNPTYVDLGSNITSQCG
uniref:Uncharacterized protein n=1 Tax=Sphaerodactylus townsendi TaxID=933632 RepID=A0ACB8FY60_9SAUR